jgi:hypothetical protein
LVLDFFLFWLVGWVCAEQLIPWNSVLEIRPHKDLGDDGHACAYVSRGDALKGQNCQEIFGGPQWLRRNFYLPIVATHERDGLWEVVVATKVRLDEPAAGPTSAAPEWSDVGDEGDPQLEQFNRVDVFFLIDGTYSMRPWIDAILGAEGRPGLIQQVQSQLADELPKGVRVRYGFRVFTDTWPAGQSSLGPAHRLLSDECGKQTAAQVEAHNRAFQDALAKVQRRPSEEGDDYFEDVYGGIDQALKDMAGCLDHMKILIVVGDGGYAAETQRERGVEPIDEDQLIERAAAFDRFNLFFLRPPEDQRVLRRWRGETRSQAQDRQDKFRAARKAFAAQGGVFVDALKKARLARLEAAFAAAPADHGDGASRLAELNRDGFGWYADVAFSDRDAADEIVRELGRRITQAVDPDTVLAVQIDLATGASVVEAIARLPLERDDVPVRLWKQTLLVDLCQRLGLERCFNRVVDLTQTVFVRRDETFPAADGGPRIPAFIPGVMLHQVAFNDLRNWVRDVSAGVNNTTVGQNRDNLLRLMLAHARRLARQEGTYSSDSVREILQQGANLPIREDSPLLRYDAAEIYDPQRVPACEVDALINWLASVKTMLDTVATGTERPSFDPAEVAVDRLCPGQTYSEQLCPGLTQKGKAIPRVAGAIRPIRVNPDDPEANLLRDISGEGYYHLPLCYLP